jgi:hypothetical protein
VGMRMRVGEVPALRHSWAGGKHGTLGRLPRRQPQPAASCAFVSCLGHASAGPGGWQHHSGRPHIAASLPPTPQPNPPLPGLSGS